MAATMQLDIVSLDQNIFSGAVRSVTFTSTEGELTVLPHHINLVTPIRAGEIIFRQDGHAHHLVTGNGFCTVADNTVSILVSSAHKIDQLDEDKILAAQRKAEELLQKKESIDHAAFADATGVLERSLAQIKFLRKHRKH